jgi:hypothetical protein
VQGASRQFRNHVSQAAALLTGNCLCGKQDIIVEGKGRSHLSTSAHQSSRIIWGVGQIHQGLIVGT